VGPTGWLGAGGLDPVALQSSFRSSARCAGSRWEWPVTLVPIARVAGGAYACVDTSVPAAPVLGYDPGCLELDERGFPVDAATALVELSPSLAGWLTDWLESPARAA
jgi:hypothetical protein